MNSTTNKNTARGFALVFALVSVVMLAIVLAAANATSALANDDKGKDDASSPAAVATQSDDSKDKADEKAGSSKDAEKSDEKAKVEVKTQSEDSEPAVKTQADENKVDPATLTLVVGGKAAVATATFATDHATIVAVPSDDSVASCEVKYDSANKKAEITVTPKSKAGTTKVALKEKKEDTTAIMDFEVTVKMRTVTVEVDGPSLDKVTIKATAGGSAVTPTKKENAFDFEVTAADQLVYTVSAAGYKDATGVVDAGDEDTTSTAVPTPIEYTITYNLDKGKNAKANPSTYTIESDDIVLAAPTREDYKFTGWTYTGQTTPKKSVTIKHGTTGNLTYKAHWEKLASGMKVAVSNDSVTYDAKPHSLKITSSNVKNIRVRYSDDKGQTYTVKEKPTFTDAGTHTVYYKVFDKDGKYASKKGTAELKITATDTVKDDDTGIIATGDIFTQYTTNTRIVQLEASDITDNSAKSSHISELKKKYFNSSTMDVFRVYDVSLLLVNRNEGTEKELTSDFGKVTLTFPVKSSYNGNTATIYELHDNGNKVTEIPFKNLKVTDGTVKATVDKLSEFVVVVNKKGASSGTSSGSTTAKAKGSSAAKTGDPLSPAIPAAILVVAVAAGAFAFFRFRKLDK